MNAVLEAVDLEAGYGEVPVVRRLKLEIRPGEIVALLGANGAGKTTTLLTLAGLVPALSGQVMLNGQATSAPLHRRAQAGLMLVPEARSVFMRMTVRDNMRVGRGAPERVLETFPELRDHVGRKAGLLSGGQQQMLTLGRALACEPKVLLADELSLGLAPQLVTRLMDAVRAAVKDRGMGALLVEQHIHTALGVADRAYVLRRGSVVLQGSASEMRRRIGEIEQAYLHGPAPEAVAT